MDPSRQKVLLAIVWLLLFSVLWLWWDERTLPDIRGEWVSAGCEEVLSPNGVSRMKRTMALDEEAWRLKIDFYGGEGCTGELFSLDIEGPYDLGPKSLETRGATTARFDIRKMVITPRTAEAVQAFDEGRCAAGNWKIDEGQEITEMGCLGLVPTSAACPTEYDIVKIEDGKLYLGDRSQGMCVPERYPEAFGPMPLQLKS